jgi:hypothetical protein
MENPPWRSDGFECTPRPSPAASQRARVSRGVWVGLERQKSTHPDAVPVPSYEPTSEAVKDEPGGHGGVVLVLTGPCTASLRV